MAPLVSVLTPVYNRADYLPRAVESVLAQDMTDLELIISDNQSSDESLALAEQYARQDSRIKVFRNETFCSGVENFNLCYRRSDPGSTYIALLASDDWWEPSYLGRLTTIGKQYTDAAFLYADMYRTDATGAIVNRYSNLYPHNTPPAGPHRAARELFQGNYVNIMAAIIRRTALQTLLPYDDLFDPSLKLTPDYHLWLMLMIQQAQAYYLDEPLAYYRKHDDAMTMSVRMIPRLTEEVTIFRDKIKAFCPPELEDARREALERNLSWLGFELLMDEQPDEAAAPLREAHILSRWRRRDLTVARIIAALPWPAAQRARLWNAAQQTAQLAARMA